MSDPSDDIAAVTEIMALRMELEALIVSLEFAGVTGLVGNIERGIAAAVGRAEVLAEGNAGAKVTLGDVAERALEHLADIRARFPQIQDAPKVQ